MVNDLRTELYAHLQKLSLAFHTRQQTGDLLFRVMSDTFCIQSMVMNGLLPLVSAASTLGLMFWVINWLGDSASPSTATRWAGPMTTTREMVDHHGRTRAYALAATGPE